MDAATARKLCVRARARDCFARRKFCEALLQVLSDNIISKIQGLEPVPLLRRLNLNGNKIRHLDNLGHLQQLEHLFVTDNVISKEWE